MIAKLFTSHLHSNFCRFPHIHSKITHVNHLHKPACTNFSIHVSRMYGFENSILYAWIRNMLFWILHFCGLLFLCARRHSQHERRCDCSPNFGCSIYPLDVNMPSLSVKRKNDGIFTFQADARMRQNEFACIIHCFSIFPCWFSRLRERYDFCVLVLCRIEKR